MSTLAARIQSLNLEQRRQLRAFLARQEGTRGAAPRRGEGRSASPLSLAQKRIWLLAQLEPDNPSYNIPAAYVLRGALDLVAFHAALEAVARRHEILRTTFAVNEDGEPRQMIGVAPALDVLCERERRPYESATALMRETANTPFDLARGPLWRVRLYALDDGAWLLAMSFHHLIFDGWSSGLFAREVFSHYETLKRRPETAPAMPPLQYADYVEWQERSFDAPRRETESTFWKTALAGELPLLELPADRSRPERRSSRGALCRRVLPRRLFDAVVALARQESATPYAAFLALLKTLLYRYTGLQDLIVGTPASGRAIPEVEPMIGMFVNTLPIRTIVSEGASYRELLRAVSRSSLDAFAHQELPFDAIVEVVQPPRQRGVNPIFQVLYAYQNVFSPITSASLAVSALETDVGTAKFDLSLDIYEADEGAQCVFEYSTDLFDAPRIERLAAHFEQLARAVVAAPDEPVARLPLLTPAETDDLRRALERPRHEWPADTFVAQFERQAAAHADAVAVRDGSRSVTYAALRRQAGALAAHLARSGVGPGDVVGVCMPRSAETIVAALGVMQAGAAFVALDPGYPRERLRFIAEDTRMRHVVSLAAHEPIASALGAAVVLLDSPLLHSSEEADAALCAPRGAHTAYVVYTSGTTGQPKGVCVTHANWMNSYFGWEQEYRLSELHAHLQMASFPFDVFCGDLARALCSGKTLVICPQELYAQPDRMLELIEQGGVDCAEFVPAVFRQFAEYLFDSGRRLEGVRILIVASDSWYVQECRAYQALCGKHTRLINSYGMAEAAIDSTWFEGEVAHGDAGRLVPIGRPFPNVAVLVLDANLQPLPAGVEGELCVAGSGVARGYLNRDELTREKFIDCPLPWGGSVRLYRTGDYGRLAADGNLELIGRRDHQVKIRGLRIELGEIETALRRQAGVRACAAMVREDTPGDKRIVAYLVLDQGAELPQPAALDAGLADALPGYMIPGDYVVLDELPLSGNGKVDRKRLPRPAQRGEAAGSYVAPRSLVEERMATIWCDVFQAARVGVHDDFFALGGHSLLACQIVARVRAAFRVDLSLQALFENPTVAGLSAAVAALEQRPQAHTQSEEALPQIVPAPQDRYLPFPLTDVQQAYWLGRNEVFEASGVSTHSYDELEVVGLDVARLERAWNKVVAKHEMLRAIIQPDGLQRILPEVPPYRIACQDLGGTPPEQAAQTLERVRAELSHQMLDLAQWPVFDIRASLLDGERMRVHFSSDAVMFDVWSFVILLEDWVKFYLDEALPAQPSELSFRDYVLAERELQDSPAHKRALEYWKRRVAEMPPAPELPLARDPQILSAPRFSRLHGALDAQAWKALKRRAERAGLTPTGVVLAAYAEAIAAYSANPAFSLNMTFLKRRPLHPQVNQVVGEFTSLNLLSVNLEPQASFVERARRIQADLWNDLEHHDVSGVQVLRELARSGGGVTRAKMPVVFTSALVVPIPEQAPDFPVVPIYRDGITQTPQVWLDCGVWEGSGALLCNWDVVRELFPEGLLERMFADFWRLLERLASDAAAWESTAPLAAPPAPAAPPVPHGGATLPELFLASLARDLEAAAVIAGERSLSYRELGEHAAYAAAQVAEAAIGPNELVAVAMEKGWEQVAAVLGVACAGAAYVPVDPALPDERVRLLLEQGRVRLLLTQPRLAPRLQALAPCAVGCLTAAHRRPLESLYTLAAPAPDDLAYVIFTSGSTGLPKGVMIDHRGVTNTLEDINKRFGIGPRDRALAISSLSFDLSVYDIFGLLAAGGAVVIPDHERRLDPTHWAQLMERHGVTLWNSVPALAGLLIDYLEESGRPLPTLRHALLSGDWIPLALPDRIRRSCPGAAVTSLGGATEASIWSVIYPIGQVDGSWSSIPYGRGMRHQSLHVLDERLGERPDWVSGELYIGGIGLARGYWGDAQKTARAFVTDPVSGERLYRTGDLGRRLPGGNIEFLGRNDFQVKVQGYRIEPGEIEAALAAHPQVRQAVVVAHGSRAADKRLAAWVVAHAGADIDVASLRGFLRERLPEYVVPQHIGVLPELPLSANGKVDRQALPSDRLAMVTVPRQHVAPRDALEQRIAGLWGHVLGVADPGVEDDFFECGGDSMLAIRLLTALRGAFDFDFQLKHVFQARTIASLAVLVRGGTCCN